MVENEMIALQTTQSDVPRSKRETLLALQDIFLGLIWWRAWALMGWQDIRKRYRRSLLGPFWLTLSMAIMVWIMGVLFSKLFRQPIEEFLPFLTVGLLIWGLISGVILEGCQVFIGGEVIIKQIKIFHTTHVYQLVWRNFIIFAHNFVVFIGVAIYFRIWPGIEALMMVPGLVMIALNSVWVALLMGIISTRFRDFPQIVASLLQVAFFMTPIIWKPELLAKRVVLLQGNPFFHFIELVRSPLLGRAVPMETWIIVFGITLAGYLLTFIVFRRFRSRIAYWL